MLSKARLKFVRSLEHKKYRKAEGMFVAEGPKTVADLLAVMPAAEIFATPEWAESHQSLLRPGCTGGTSATVTVVTVVTSEELKRLSFLQHPQQVLAVFPLPEEQDALATAAATADSDTLQLALDGIQDPGNLGTIIRLADWFGIETIYCSPDTADAYSPKAVQATMGSLARVQLIYCELPTLVDSLPPSFPVYGTMLAGDSIYSDSLSTNGLVVMGNEGRGLSPETAARVRHRLLIPPYPTGRDTAESLNVATATAIVCAEFRRRQRPSQ